MPTFEELGITPERLAILEAQAIKEPSPIQALTLPVLLEGRDAFIAAQTGSGKTLSYMLPIVERLCAKGGASVAPSASSGGSCATPYAIVLVPTQELGIQVRDVARGLLEGTGRTVVELIGGANPVRQGEKLKKGADIVVGTAGRVVDFMKKGRLSLARCKSIIFDEADQLIDKAHKADVTTVLTSIPVGRQIVAVSATLGPEIRAWSARYMREPADLEANTKLTLPAGLSHQAFVVDDRDQLPLLRKILVNLDPVGALAFFNRTADIDFMVAKLQHHGVRAAGLHAGIDKHGRAEAMREFKTGKLQLLLATELGARGLDLSAVTLVINLDVPRAPDNYIHRVGRTARMGREGVAITFVDPKEEWVLEKYEKALEITFERPTYMFGELRETTPADIKRVARKERVAEVREAEKAEPKKKKKEIAKATHSKTAASKAKGKLRKAERKSQGIWKPADASERAAWPKKASGSAPRADSPAPDAASDNS